MFKRWCRDSSTHWAHKYTKTWRKVDLPYLRNPDTYPASWQARYKCPGVKNKE